MKKIGLVSSSDVDMHYFCIHLFMWQYVIITRVGYP